MDDTWEVVADEKASHVDPLPVAVPSLIAGDGQREPVVQLPPKLKQLDVIVLDVSRSMKARSTVDVDKTREDLSKLVFHTMVDKMLCLEMDHAVGLLAFGALMQTFPLTTNYEVFHTELGRLDANQNATKLFDSIAEAVKVLVEFRASHKDEVEETAPMRIFALTDGEDNASTTAPWFLSRLLQQSNIVLDVFPMACSNKLLHAVCAATGGMCVKVDSVEQGIQLFEQESLVHIACRSSDPNTEIHKMVQTEEDFKAILASINPVQVVSIAPTNNLINQTIDLRSIRATADTLVALLATNQSQQPTTVQTRSGTSMKRVLKELSQLNNTLTHVEVFVCDGDCTTWKVLVPGPNGTPYVGGHFVISFSFPLDYPFHPPKVRFLTPIYHCNVNHDGAVCLDVLKDRWSPALTVSSVIQSLEMLLANPNTDDPLDSLKAQVYREDKAKYMAAATALTSAHATPKQDVIRKYNLQ